MKEQQSGDKVTAIKYLQKVLDGNFTEVADVEVEMKALKQP